MSKTTKRKGRSLLEADRRRLDASIPHDAHQGLRMLRSDCSQELSKLNTITCPVDTTAGEFFCAQVNDVQLDASTIKDLIKPIIEPLVNQDKTGTFDKIAQPLLPLDQPIPGVSDIAGRDIAILDIAEIFIGPKSGAPQVRQLLSIYRSLNSLADTFKSMDQGGVRSIFMPMDEYNSCLAHP